MTQEACTARFVEQFSALGGEIQTFASVEALKNGLEACLQELGADLIGAWGQAADWPLDVEDVLQKWNAIRWDESTVTQFASVQVGITSCAYAIADTGTLVMMSSQDQGRSVHLISAVHLVVMTADQIRLRLGEVFADVQKLGETAPDQVPASIHFVSGPSRSSDIENDQSIGVHGPARVIILLLDAQ